MKQIYKLTHLTPCRHMDLRVAFLRFCFLALAQVVLSDKVTQRIHFVEKILELCSIFFVTLP